MIGHVTLAIVDDWEALYINGDRRYEGHSVPLREALLALVGYRVASFNTLEVLPEWVEDNSGFPFNLNDIPQEVRLTS